MGWFEEQIGERRESDARLFAEALRELSDAIRGRESRESDADRSREVADALEAIVTFYGLKGRRTPPQGLDLRELMDYYVEATGVMYRAVRLTPGWHRDAIGPMLGFLEDATPVALLPGRRGYAYRDPTAGTLVSVGSRGDRGLLETAFCFYRPLPNHPLTVGDFALHVLRSLTPKDYAIVVGASLAVTLLGLVVPLVNRAIFGPVAEYANVSILLPVLVLLLGVGFGQVVIGAIRTLVMEGLATRLDLPLTVSMMMRVLSLPAPFFRDFEAGDLASRLTNLRELSRTIGQTMVSTVLGAGLSLVYVWQIIVIVPELSLSAVLVTAASLAVIVVSIRAQIAFNRERLPLLAASIGWQHDLFEGVRKLKLAGAERRGFATWAHRIAPMLKVAYGAPALSTLGTSFALAVSLIGSIVFYDVAMAAEVPVADYMAFASAYAMVTSAFSELAGSSDSSLLRPTLELVAPFLEATPESGEGRVPVPSLSGSIELDAVTFSYGGDPVLRDLSLKIRRGQFVGVVGRSGSGKSTLLRLLLGFETPTRGAVYYDGQDARQLDAMSLRRHIGAVLQDARLFPGDILSNITVGTPWVTEEDAWRAAERAGIADDIRAMPLGMRTLVSEGGGELAAGQRQRLMIARTLAAEPKVLLLDEALNSVDAITQRRIVEAVGELRCTRVVVAQRLSALRACDRIIVLERGRIVEDGTYDDLMAAHGTFHDLASSQRVI